MSNIYRERTNLRTLNVSIVVAGIGILLFVVSHMKFIAAFPDIQTLIRDFGSLLIASIAVALIWELFSKRAFMSELLKTTKLADEVQESGLIGISPKWHGEIDWTSLLRRSDNVNIFFMYGRTWRNINRSELQNFARKPNTKATVILPDINNAQLISELARNIENTPEELIDKVEEAVREFIAIFDVDGKGAEKLTIFSTSVFPVYSFYQLENVAIVTFYTLDKGKKEVPTLVFEKGGTLFDFFASDFNAVKQSDSCRRIYPVDNVE